MLLVQGRYAASAAKIKDECFSKELEEVRRSYRFALLAEESNGQ